MHLKLILALAVACIAVNVAIASPLKEEDQEINLINEIRSLLESRGKGSGRKEGKAGRKGSRQSHSEESQMSNEDDMPFHHKMIKDFEDMQEGVKGFLTAGKAEAGCQESNHDDMFSNYESVKTDQLYSATTAYKSLFEEMQTALAVHTSQMQGLDASDINQHIALGKEIYGTMETVGQKGVCTFLETLPLVIRMGIFGFEQTERCNKMVTAFIEYAINNGQDLTKEACNIVTLAPSFLTAFRSDVQCIKNEVDKMVHIMQEILTTLPGAVNASHNDVMSDVFMVMTRSVMMAMDTEAMKQAMSHFVELYEGERPTMCMATMPEVDDAVITAKGLQKQQQTLNQLSQIIDSLKSLQKKK